jgi:PmbA protein
MLELIKNILSSNGEISGYKVVEERVESNELFFVRKELDMDRAKNVHNFRVTVYKNFEEDGIKYTGSSTTQIHPTMSEEEIKNVIDDAAFAAGFVKNEFYPLPKPSSLNPKAAKSKFAEKPIADFMPALTEAVYKNDTFENGGINSTEVFLNKINTRIVNSEGIDVSFEKYAGEVEFITDWKEEGEEIELYKDIKFSEPDLERITEEVSVMLQMANERALADMLPALEDCPVLLSGEPVKDFFSYYFDQALAQYAYNNLSTAKLNENIQGSEASGDLVTISLDPALENSTASAPYDRDGLALTKVTLFENGKLVRYCGDARHAYYLNTEPTGIIENIVIEGGSKSEEELKAAPYLELAAFSSFQMDSITGDFGGEIRLGWYFDGKERMPITGGSISGNVNEVHSNMYFSKELQQDNNFKGPKIVQLFNVSISGC